MFSESTYVENCRETLFKNKYNHYGKSLDGPIASVLRPNTRRLCPSRKHSCLGGVCSILLFLIFIIFQTHAGNLLKMTFEDDGVELMAASPRPRFCHFASCSEL